MLVIVRILDTIKPNIIVVKHMIMLIYVYWIQLHQNIIVVEHVIMLINVYWIQLNQNIIIVEHMIMLIITFIGYN